MNIYLVSRTTLVGYDEYDSFVVYAENEAQAKELAIVAGYPHSEEMAQRDDIYRLGNEETRSKWDNARIEFLGTSLVENAGIILGSYHAG